MNDVIFQSNNDEWSTPEHIYNKLNAEFNFNLDPCATDDNHKCDRYYTMQDDGLSQNWGGVYSLLQSPI